MNVYTIKGFQGHYPVGTAAIVVAESKERALVLLNEELTKEYLPSIKDTDIAQLRLVDLNTESVDILCTGDY